MGSGLAGQLARRGDVQRILLDADVSMAERMGRAADDGLVGSAAEPSVAVNPGTPALTGVAFAHPPPRAGRETARTAKALNLKPTILYSRTVHRVGLLEVPICAHPIVC